MIVDYSHRKSEVSGNVLSYQRLFAEISSYLSESSIVKSFMLIGSLAKGTLKPGWSDLDLIIFLCDKNGKNMSSNFFSLVSNLGRLSQKHLVPIGVDFVNWSEAFQLRELPGRRLAMSIEVSHYGQVFKSESPLPAYRDDEVDWTRIHQENRLAVAAELLTWKRSAFQCDRNDLSWLFNCAKSLLRIIMIEGGPIFSGPVNTSLWLENIKHKEPNHPTLPAFETAVLIRNEWDSKKLRFSKKILFEMEKALVLYQLLRSNL